MDNDKLTQLVTKRVVLQLDGISIVRSWSCLFFHWLFCIKKSVIGACSELVVEFEQRLTYFGLLWASWYANEFDTQ